jgi:FkbM family methyltransferase
VLEAINRFFIYILCALELGTTMRDKWNLIWKETKNIRVGLGIDTHHNDQIYSLQTIYGKLYFRDNFGDITNLPNIYYRRVYPLTVLRSDGVILDVGANIGLAAAWFNYHNPGKTIYCFEPLASNAALIGLNCPSAHVEQVALGASRGKIQLGVDSDEVMASYVANPRSAVEIEFPVLPLDDFILENKIERIALMKIDSEGMEIEILSGAKDALAITKQVAMETHGSERHDAARNILYEAGFAITYQKFHKSTGILVALKGV